MSQKGDGFWYLLLVGLNVTMDDLLTRCSNASTPTAAQAGVPIATPARSSGEGARDIEPSSSPPTPTLSSTTIGATTPGSGAARGSTSFAATKRDAEAGATSEAEAIAASLSPVPAADSSVLPAAAATETKRTVVLVENISASVVAAMSAVPTPVAGRVLPVLEKASQGQLSTSADSTTIEPKAPPSICAVMLGRAMDTAHESLELDALQVSINIAGVYPHNKPVKVVFCSILGLPFFELNCVFCPQSDAKQMLGT